MHIFYSVDANGISVKKSFRKKYMYTTWSWEVWGTISLYKIPNRKNLHRKSSMCCGDSTPFQGVFKKAEDFLDYRGLYFLFFYLMNIISKSSKHFQLAHLVKATVLNLVAYSSHTVKLSGTKLRTLPPL